MRTSVLVGVHCVVVAIKPNCNIINISIFVIMINLLFPTLILTQLVQHYQSRQHHQFEVFQLWPLWRFSSSYLSYSACSIVSLRISSLPSQSHSHWNSFRFSSSASQLQHLLNKRRRVALEGDISRLSLVEQYFALIGRELHSDEIFSNCCCCQLSYPIEDQLKAPKPGYISPREAGWTFPSAKASLYS